MTNTEIARTRTQARQIAAQHPRARIRKEATGCWSVVWDTQDVCGECGNDVSTEGHAVCMDCLEGRR